jgi:hypothetical protein
MDWFTSILPLTPDQNKEDLDNIDPIESPTGTKFCVSNWRAYLNSKADMAGAGYEGREYQNRWVPFTDMILFQMLGLLALDGIAPSPQMEMKCKPQSVEPSHGNDRVTESRS